MNLTFPLVIIGWLLGISSAEPLIKGVALGGWLLLEPYITPSLFEVFENPSAVNTTERVPVDEYGLCKGLGLALAQEILETHWSSFYTEADFRDIKAAGLNLVRIPIGYWAFHLLDSDPYVQGQEAHLDEALGWARTHGLLVWVDLHGVPGSQNGFDNSGKRGEVGWLRNQTNVDVTLRVLDYIFGKYGLKLYADTIVGIELVNEPLGPLLNMSRVQSIYNTSYQSAVDTYKVGSSIVLHDAFQGLGYWDAFLPHSNVVIDHHHYEVFTLNQLNNTMAERVRGIMDYGSSIADHLSNHSAVVGEWSAALTDCAWWLNGVNVGSRYDGTYPDAPPVGVCRSRYATLTKDEKKQFRLFVEAQLNAYEQTSGWIFWCWKTEDAFEWDFQQLIELTIMPQPLTKRSYTKELRDMVSGASRPRLPKGLLLCLLGVVAMVLASG